MEGRLHRCRNPPIRRKSTPALSEANLRFTTAANHLYVFGYKHPAGPASQVRIVSLAAGKAQVARVTLLGNGQPLTYSQTAEALLVTVPPLTLTGPDLGYVLKVKGTYPLSAA